MAMEEEVLGFFVPSVFFLLTETRPPFDSGKGENPLKSAILLPLQPRRRRRQQRANCQDCSKADDGSLAPTELLIGVVVAFE